MGKWFYSTSICCAKKNLINILNKVSLFFKMNKIFSTFIIIKKMSEKGDYLTFYGNGISVSLDIPINRNFDKLKIFLTIFIEEEVRITFPKICLLNIILQKI